MRSGVGLLTGNDTRWESEKGYLRTLDFWSALKLQNRPTWRTLTIIIIIIIINNNNNNDNLICIAPVCAKRLQWRWRTGLITAIKCLTENICLYRFKYSQWIAACNVSTYREFQTVGAAPSSWSLRAFIVLHPAHVAMLRSVRGWVAEGLLLASIARCDLDFLGGASSPWAVHESTYVGLWSLNMSCESSHTQTRKLCYRKDDRAMRPMYGRPENYLESLTSPTATFPEFLMGFCSDWAHKCACKIWNP